MIYIFITTGFEEVEALTPVDVFRRSGLAVSTISMTSNLYVESSHQVTIKCDHLFENCTFQDATAIIIPGGMPAAENLSNDIRLQNLISQHQKSNTLICAICAGPMILGKMNLLTNKNCTCYPTFDKYLYHANYTGNLIEQDGNIITGKGPSAAFEFSFKILEELLGTKKATETRRKMMF